MIKTLGAKIYAAIAHRKNQKWITRPIDAQKKVFNLLIKRGLKTRFGKEHDLHKRRRGRNLGLGLVLIGFVAIIFGLTVVKVTEGQFAEALAGASRNE